MRSEAQHRAEPGDAPDRSAAGAPRTRHALLALQRAAGNHAVTALVGPPLAVQRVWYANPAQGRVVWVPEGQDQEQAPVDRGFLAELEQTNRSGHPYEVHDRAGQDDVGGTGWTKADVLVKRARRFTGEPPVKRPRTQAPSTPLITRPEQADPGGLSALPVELLVRVVEWLTEVRQVLDKRVAQDPAQVAVLSQLSRTWYHLVKDNQERFGYYPDGLNAIVDKHRAAGHPAARKAGVLDRDDRLGLRLVADELTRRYPADRWTYVSLGNSPALFMEYYAQVEPAAQVVLLPLSGVDGSELREPGTEPYRMLLDYADRLLPERHHDRLVVVDMAEHGRGLAVTKQLLDAVLQRRGRAATTGLYALTPRKPAASGEDLSHLEPELSRLALLGDADTAPGHERTVRKLRERLIGCYYKSDLLLNVFEKHNSMDVLAGARTGPTLDAGAYQRVQLVVRHARALLDAGPGQVG